METSGTEGSVYGKQAGVAKKRVRPGVVWITAILAGMHPPRNSHVRAVVEIAFIIFLFYANLLMGEFTVLAGKGKTLAAALRDIVTPHTVVVAVVTAVIGHFGFSLLRQRS
jgi:hypothetical protein